MEPNGLHVKVLNRKQAVKLQYKHPTGTKAAMVSISSVGERYGACPRPGGDVGRVLYLNFDDVTDKDDGCLFTVKDAMKIRDFVEACLETGTHMLYVHCDEGLSRSAAVARALHRHYVLPMGNVEYREGSRPNPHVYGLMLEALEN